MGAKPPPMKRGLGGKAPQLGNSQFCDRFSYVFFGFSCISPPIYPTQNPLFPNRSCLDCWGRGRGRVVLVQQVLICEGNKPQIQSNPIIIHRKNLFFFIKSWSRFKVQIYPELGISKLGGALPHFIGGGFAPTPPASNLTYYRNFTNLTNQTGGKPPGPPLIGCGLNRGADPLLLTYPTNLLTLILLRFICRPPIKDIVLALAGLFEVLFCLFLHFVLLVYNFLVHIIGFSK